MGLMSIPEASLGSMVLHSASCQQWPKEALGGRAGNGSTRIVAPPFPVLFLEGMLRNGEEMGTDKARWGGKRKGEMGRRVGARRGERKNTQRVRTREHL